MTNIANEALIRGLYDAVNKKDLKTMQVNFCDVYRLKDGKIMRADSYFDFYGLLKQLAPEKIA